MVRSNGLGDDFARGRDYEQQETYVMLTSLLHIAENEQVRDLLSAWRQDIMDHLIGSNYVVTIEETFLVIE